MIPSFEQEDRCFESHRGEWIVRGEVDRWVAIRDDVPFGFWDSLDDSVKAVQKEFGDEPVYIRQILVEDPVHWI
jgi:hypothetical protein